MRLRNLGETDRQTDRQAGRKFRDTVGERIWTRTDGD